MYLRCVPYYSLPEFPESCAVVTNHDVLLRDVLLCNRTNRIHIEDGFQYDPNIENGEYRVCEPRVRRSLEKWAKSFDELYLIFRTRFIKLDGSLKYLVPGFFKIKKEFAEVERDGPVIKADHMRFVSTQNSVDVTKQFLESRAFRASPSSLNPKWSKKLLRWVTQLENEEDITDTYIQEISRLKSFFQKNEFGDRHYPVCQTCSHSQADETICPLCWRRRFYGQSPEIAAHYMKNLNEFYAKLAATKQLEKE